MVPLSYHNCIFLFQSFIVISCKKNNYEVSNNIIIILSLNTNLKSGWTLILILMIAIFFWQLHIFVSYHREDITNFRWSHPCQILLISSCDFSLNNLCKIIDHKKSSRYDQNTRKRLQGVKNINTHKWLVKYI